MSGLIPQSFIDDLLYKTDLVELIDSFVPLKKRGTSFIACCPFHNEKSPSFNVVASKQFYHCFGCSASGNAISFVMNYQNLGFVEAVETLAIRLGVAVPREGQLKKNNPASDLYTLLAKISAYYQKNLKLQGQAAIEYLRSRELSGSVAKLYQIGFACDGWHNLEKIFPHQQNELIATGMLVKTEDGKIYDRYRNRITFPIQDRHGRIIGFGGRVLDNQKPKYLNSPETVLFQKSRELYGLYQILSLKNSIDYIIIVEGYMDVMALAQHGIANAVATLGTATSIYHIQLLAKHTKQLIFCFDGDTAGKQAAWKALESSFPYLNSGLDANFIFLPENHDPDSLIRAEGKDNFLNRLQKATPLPRFFFDTLSKDINLLSPGGKTQLINLAKPLLQKMMEGSYKQLLIDDLSRLTHIESHRLHTLIHNVADAKILEKNTTIARSPARLAVALLLQNPELYLQSTQFITIDLLDTQDHQILLKIFQQLKTNPQANTATLIEAWRNSAYFEAINKLAAWDHQVPEQELLKEFVDILLFLQKQNQDIRIRQLIDKSRHTGLNDQEKANLFYMLKERHVQEPEK